MQNSVMCPTKKSLDSPTRQNT